jgi:hypothetical protein
MDKSPLKTLTLEDFLESERHKLTGTLTPVTPETFAKWKKERLDKRAAEEQAQKAKEATGKAMFESGDWKDEDESSDDDGDDEDDAPGGVWNLEAMRRETERLRMLKEEERLAKLNGAGVMPEIPVANGYTPEVDNGGEGGSSGNGYTPEDDNAGEGSSSGNGSTPEDDNAGEGSSGGNGSTPEDDNGVEGSSSGNGEGGSNLGSEDKEDGDG